MLLGLWILFGFDTYRMRSKPPPPWGLLIDASVVSKPSSQGGTRDDARRGCLPGLLVATLSGNSEATDIRMQRHSLPIGTVVDCVEISGIFYAPSAVVSRNNEASETCTGSAGGRAAGLRWVFFTGQF